MKITKIIKKNKDAVILLAIVIRNQKGQQISIRGTGFIISENGKFITNAHVYKKISENEKQYLKAKVPLKKNEKGFTEYRDYDVELIKTDDENDIVSMKIVTNDDTKFNIINNISDSESVAEGDEVMFLGYPLATELLAMGFGITLSANNCIISSVKRRSSDGSLHFFLIDTHTNKGSSGSPIFLKKSGKVIGIVSGNIGHKIPAPDNKGEIIVPANIGICRPAKYIREIIK